METNQKTYDYIEDGAIEEEMRSSYLDYAMSVIVGRALPDVRDGLKPVHRRVLYTMHQKGLQPNRAYAKCAATVGTTMGDYHPHGDSAIYDTMVRLAQPFAQRYPLVDGQGNFGSVDNDPAAAMRYTEARLTAVATEMLRDIDAETVDFTPSYDGSKMEPVVLPAKYPNLLVNGSSGIAVGMATNIPPHNLGEVIDATIAYIDNPDIGLGELMQLVPGPDFPTGGLIVGRQGIRDAYETGHGRVIMRGVTHVETLSGGKEAIIVSELPYQVSKGDGRNEGAGIIKKMAELVNDKKIPEITDLRDESDQTGIRIVIELRRDAMPQIVLNKLHKHTALQTSFGVNMVALVEGVPRTVGLKDIIHFYVQHQRQVMIRRTKFELRKRQARVHILDGLLIALDALDQVIELIRASNDPDKAKIGLIESFGLSAIQAQAILDLRLQRLTAMETDKVKEEHAGLLTRIDELRAILADENKLMQVIKDELELVRDAHVDERRSVIVPSQDDINVEDLIPDQQMVVAVTGGGYIKTLPLDTYRQQRRGGVGVSGMELKEDDYIEHLRVCSSHDYLLFFTNRGKVYRLKVWQLPEASRASRGRALVNLLPLAEGEEVRALLPTRSFNEGDYLLFASRKGRIKKTEFLAYNTPIKEAGIIAVSLGDGDELISVRQTSVGDDVVMLASSGRANRFAESQIKSSGRATTGVRGIRLAKDSDVLLSMNITTEGSQLLVVTDQGYGKRSPLEQFAQRKRGGVGVRAISLTEQKGQVTGALVVQEDEEILFISTQGMVQRTPVAEIPCYGRTSQGIRLMNLHAGDRISAVAIVPREEVVIEEAAAEPDTNPAASITNGNVAPIAPIEVDQASESAE